MAKAPKTSAAAASSSAGSGRLAGKIALVTGAAGNIGGYIVRQYLAQGATVVMTGRTRERIEAAAKAAAVNAGVPADRVMAVVFDGGDMASVRAGIAEVVKRFGRIDILVNNAGSAGVASRQVV